MARKYWRRKQSDKFEDAIEPFIALFVLGLIGYVATHWKQIVFIELLVLGIFLAVAVIVYKKRKRNASDLG